MNFKLCRTKWRAERIFLLYREREVTLEVSVVYKLWRREFYNKNFFRILSCQIQNITHLFRNYFNTFQLHIYPIYRVSIFNSTKELKPSSKSADGVQCQLMEVNAN